MSFSTAGLLPTPSLFSASTPTSRAIVTTLPTNSGLLARDDYSGSASSSCPNEVIVQLATAVLIPDYDRYYRGPIRSFQPSFTTFADGSLVAPPYLHEVVHAYKNLLFIGAMLMLFVRNSLVSADYIRRGRVKHKGLFYVLLVSQLLGVVAFAVEASAFVADRANCTAILITQNLAAELSAALLLTGILGVKAYRCLGNSKFVLVAIILPQVASTTLVIHDLIGIRTFQRLSKQCSAATPFMFYIIVVGIRIFSSVVISACFIYALVKSSRFPGAQGRISIALSDNPSHEQDRRVSVSTSSSSEHSDLIQVSNAIPRPRGWWDYVPDRPQSSLESPAKEKKLGFFQRFHFFKSQRRLSESWKPLNEKPPVPQPLTSVPRPLTVHFSDSGSHTSQGIDRASSPAPSAVKSIGRFMSRRKLFTEVMRNELASTALIAISNFLAAIFALVGVSCLFSPNIVVGGHWAILSLLVIHNFGRVIERHEREAHVQNPSSWDPLYKVEQATSQAGVIPRAISSASVASHPRRNRSAEEDIVATEDRTRNNNAGAIAVPSFEVNVVPPDNTSTIGSIIHNPFEDFRYDVSSYRINQEVSILATGVSDHIPLSPRSGNLSHLATVQTSSKKRVSFASTRSSESDPEELDYNNRIEVSGALSPNSMHSRYSSHFHFDKN